MKKLQNNFTTPEQSKRLLALGVPADSADCYYRRSHNHLKDERFPNVIVGPDILIGTYDSFSDAVKDAEGTIYETIPCWSVGRLIEILCKCGIHYADDGNLVFNFKQGRLNDIVGAFVDALEYNCKDGCIDFSKLEEYKNE